MVAAALVIFFWTALGFGAALLFGRVMRLPSGARVEEAEAPTVAKPRAYLS